MTTVVLAVLAVVLAGPVPTLLARSPWLRRTPAAATTLWQAVALAAVLAALGAGLSLTTSHLMSRPAPAARAVAALSLVLTVVVLARLLLTGHRVGTRLRVRRRRQVELVDLLARRQSLGGREVAVIAEDRPLAYCLPGPRRARVVLTEAVCDGLAPAELDAVVAHERAHLRARHDLVVEAFTVLHTAYPRLNAGAAALAEVRLLVEVLADRAAARTVGVLALARALVAVGEAATPEAALGAGHGLPVRLELLGEPRGRPVQAALVCAAAAAVLVLPTLLVVLPWLSSLR
ncbi:MAG TPA: M56 family metallopeptidase [Marmoricola sp.]|nr:M56 family metallopeptidase [Marmoricola sp.]